MNTQLLFIRQVLSGIQLLMAKASLQNSPSDIGITELTDID